MKKIPIKLKKVLLERTLSEMPILPRRLLQELQSKEREDFNAIISYLMFLKNHGYAIGIDGNLTNANEN